MTLAPGAPLGPYEILEPLGAGGMGEVYLARDSRLGRMVAVKVLRPDVAVDRDRIERFERESRAASALNHPNIVTIHDVGVAEGTSYIAMEWVDGSALRDLVAPGKPQPIPTVVSLGAQIAEGLAKAHGAGIVHRDLKPENIMVTADGLVKILDFGLAKLVAGGDNAMSLVTRAGGTAAGILLGTVGYMSPEQATGREVDHRSDQFALGVILYELATGTRAFNRDSAPQTLAAIIEDEPEPLEARNPRIPPQLSRIVARCLSKKPEDRYESTRDLAHDLRDLVHDRSAARLAPRPARRSIGWVETVAAIVVVLMLIAAGGWRFVRSRPAAAAAERARRIVAVLPFRDLTGDSSRSYFAAGLTEEIRGQLTRVSALRLLSRSAVQRYGHEAIPQLRSELGAGSALEGSVRLEGQRARVSVELIDTATEQTLWSEQYDRTLDDVLSVQSDVALRIAAALNATLGPEERTRVARPPTTNPEAYELYLRSQELSSGERQQNLRAIELLKKAISVDSTFAAAHARLAYRTFLLGYYGDPTYIDSAIEIARRALELDPDFAPTHLALASAYGSKGWAAKSRAAFLRAHELDPGNTGVISNIAVLESEILGRHDEALIWARRLLEMPKFDTGGLYHLAWPLLFLRDDATTDRWLSEGEARAHDDQRLQYLKAALDYLRGNEAAALARSRTIVETHPAFEEGLMVSAELAFLTAAPDAEAQIERLSRRAPGLESALVLKQESHQTSYAYLLMLRGERSHAATLLSEALKRAHTALENGNENQRVPFEIAAIHAARGENDQAVEWLAKAFAAGYKDYATLARHPIFTKVRHDPRFQHVLKQMEQTVAGMRERSTVLAELRTMAFPAMRR